MSVIKVPKVPKSAYNPDRPASALLQAHIAHLEHAVGLPISKPKRRRTEGEAARYIGELTQPLMQQPAAPAPPPPGTAVPAVAKPRRKRRVAKKAGRKAR